MPGLVSVKSLISRSEGPATSAGSLLSSTLGRGTSPLGKLVNKLHPDESLTKGEFSTALAKGDTVRSGGPLSALDQENHLRQQIAENGTYSMLDVPLGLVRALPPVKKVLPPEKWNNALYGYQSRLLEADRAGGEALVNALPFTKRLFTSNDMKPMLSVKTEAGDTVKGYVPTETQRLTAPADKVRDFATPFLGVLGVSTIYQTIHDAKSKNEKKEGGLVANAVSREDLIEKIARADATALKKALAAAGLAGVGVGAGALAIKSGNPATETLTPESLAPDAEVIIPNTGVPAAEMPSIKFPEGVPAAEMPSIKFPEGVPAAEMPKVDPKSISTSYKASELYPYKDITKKESAQPDLGMEKNAAMLKAASMLKLASEKIASLENERDTLAKEIEDLRLLVTAKERSSRAVKLAKDMMRRGMLKQAEYDAQIDEIMDMDDKSYDVLYNAIQSTPLIKSAAEISPWAFVLSTADTVPERKSLDDAIIETAHKR